MIESGSGSDCEAEWTENDIAPTLENYTNISGVTVELSITDK